MECSPSLCYGLCSISIARWVSQFSKGETTLPLPESCNIHARRTSVANGASSGATISPSCGSNGDDIVRLFATSLFVPTYPPFIVCSRSLQFNVIPFQGIILLQCHAKPNLKELIQL